jgi:hypothetical protein
MYGHSGEKKNMISIIQEDTVKANIEKMYSIINDHFKYDLRQDTFLAGGAIASLVNHQIPKDYDLFFTSDHNLAKFKAIIRVTDQKYIETDNAITFEFEKKDSYITLNVQFIKVNVGSPEKVVKSFDFFHCMNYYYNKSLVIKYPDSILNRELSFNIYSHNPNGAPGRYKKFVRRGYRPTKDCEKLILYHLELGKPLLATYTD